MARRGVEDYARLQVVGPVAVVFRLLTKGRNPYRQEIKGAARVLGIPYNEAVALNFLYETSQIASHGFQLWEGELGDKLRGWTATLRRHMRVFRTGAMACTAGARHIRGLGLTHVRAMDWPVEGLGRHTLILHHVNNPAGDFFSVGWPGYSGVLSGFRPGAFSATLNKAPILRMPNLQWPPAHLLRRVFETCRTYGEALRTLRQTPVCVPAFILLAGPDKAAVVELGPDGNSAHFMNGRNAIAIANDYVSAKRRKQVGTYGKTADSDNRRNAMLRRLRGVKAGDLQAALRVLKCRPVENVSTAQQMVFAHGANAMQVVGLEDEEPVAMAVHPPGKRAASKKGRRGHVRYKRAGGGAA